MPVVIILLLIFFILIAHIAYLKLRNRHLEKKVDKKTYRDSDEDSRL